MPYANNKGADQPAHPRSLISTFVVRCLEGIIPLVSTPIISSLQLASVAEQTGLSLPWSQNPKKGKTAHLDRLCLENSLKESRANFGRLFVCLL